ERGRDGEGGRGAFRVEPHQVAGGGRGAEYAQGRGRVPALGVVMEVDAEPELALGLEAGDEGGDEGAARSLALVGEREEGRQDRRRRVTAQRVVHVVEVERVGGNAVGKRGIERAGALGGAEHEARPAGAGEAAHGLRAWLAAAREGHPHTVAAAALG